MQPRPARRSRAVELGGSVHCDCTEGKRCPTHHTHWVHNTHCTLWSGAALHMHAPPSPCCLQDYDDEGLFANVLLLVVVITMLGTCGCWAKFRGVVQLQVRTRQGCAASTVVTRVFCCSSGNTYRQLRRVLST